MQAALFWKICNLAQWLKFSYGGMNHCIILIRCPPSPVRFLFPTLKHRKLSQRSCHQNIQCKLNLHTHILISFAEIIEILAKVVPKNFSLMQTPDIVKKKKIKKLRPNYKSLNKL